MNAETHDKKIMTPPHLLWLTGFLLSMIMLAGCTEREVILPGERESVILQSDIISINENASKEQPVLGEPLENIISGHPGVTSGHAGGHLSLSLPLKKVWSAQITSPNTPVIALTQPVIANDSVLALGADARLTAFALETGAIKWQAQINRPETGLFPGIAGGLAANDKFVAVHAARNTLSLLDIVSGEIIWSVEHDNPLSGGPTLIDNDAVVVTDIDGYVFVYRLSDGTIYWQNVGLPVDTVIFGDPSPAVANFELVLAGAGGEIAVHQISDGQLLWADSLASLSPTTPLEELGDVLAHSVHDGESVYVISQAGLFGAYESSSGVQLWEHRLAGVEMPWLAGDSLFVVSTDGRIFSLRKSDGGVRWITNLADSSFSSGGETRYYGPIVASDLVHVISEAGRLISLNAVTGKVVTTQSLDGPVVVAPQIARNFLISLTRSGQISAFR